MTGLRIANSGRRWTGFLPWLALVTTLLVPIWWGADGHYPWDVDNIAPGAVLKEIDARFAPGRLTQYGPVPYVLTATVYLPALALMRLTGELGTPSPEYPWGLAHPETTMTLLVLLARAVSMAMGIGVVLLTTRRGRRDAIPGAAWIVPMLALGSPDLMYYARTSNPDVQYLFWIVLAFDLLEREWSGPPGVRWPAAAAGAAALAVASKDQAFPLALTVVAAAAWRAASGRSARTEPIPGPGIGPRASARVAVWAARDAGLVLATAAGVYAIAWRLPINWLGWQRHAAYVTGAGVDPRRFPLDAGGLAGITWRYLQLAPVVFGWPILVGVAAALALRVPLRGLGLRATACALYLVSLLAVGYARPRFGLPLLLLALPLAAAGVAALVERLRTAPQALRATTMAAAVLLVAGGGPRLSAAMLADPRLAAERWLGAHLRRGSTVEIGGNPHFQARVPTLLRREVTVDDSLQAAPRGPNGDVVLVSSIDRYSFERDPLLRRAWWDPLLEAGAGGRYREETVFGTPRFAADLTVLPVAPTVWVFARRDQRLEP